MAFDNKNYKIRLGKIRKKLHLDFFYFNGASWKWKRKFFSNFYLDTRVEINPHIAIVGKSGSGKSNACKLIVRALNISGISTIVFDAHNEYVRIANDINADVYDAVRTGINIFALDGMSARERVSELTSNFKSIFRLGEVQSYTLYKCISYAFRLAMREGREAKISDLFSAIRIFKRHADKGEMLSLESIERRLAVVNVAAFSDNVDFESLVSKSSIFALSSLHTNEAQKMYIEGFLKRFYTRMLQSEKSDRIKFYIVIDEAEKLENDSMIGRIISEGRKYGVGILTIAQRAKALDESIRGNASTAIIFYQREPEELNYLSNLVACGNEFNRLTEVKKAIRNLRQGEAIVSAGRTDPEVVKFNFYKACIEYVGDHICAFAARGISKVELEEKIKGLQFGNVNFDNDMKKLLAHGTIKQCEIGFGERPGTWYITSPHNSAEHDIIVNMISAKLTKSGIRNIVYNNSYGPDLIAVHGGKRIAIEYETGSKNTEDTNKMIEGRRREYDEVLTVVNDRHVGAYLSAGIDSVSASEFFKNENVSLKGE